MAWNRPSPGQKPQQKARPSQLRGIVAGFVVVVLSVVAYVVFRGGDTSDASADTGKREPGQIKEVKPAAAPARQPVAKPLEQPKPVVEDEKPNATNWWKFPPGKDGRILTSSKTNGMYIVEMYKMPDGKMLKKYRYSKPSIWKNSTDQLLHLAMSSTPGVAMPPMPFTANGNMTKEFLESLKTPIVINEDDSEEAKAAKERVIEARETAKRLIDEGYTFEQILAETESQNQHDANLRREVVDRIEEMKREGDIDMARKYAEKANEVLRQYGILEVADPAEPHVNMHKRRGENK